MHIGNPTNSQSISLLHHPGKVIAIRMAIICASRMKAEALQYFATNHWGLEVSAVEITGEQGVAEAARTCPELVITTVPMPDMCAGDILEKLHTTVPAAKLIGLVSPCNEYLVHRLAAAPYHALLSDAEESLCTVGSAIERVRSGVRFVSPRITECRQQLRLSPTAFPKLLSNREMDVMVCIAHCLSDEEVGRQIGFTAVTAQSHRKRIMQKLGIHGATKLISYAINKGFGSAPLPLRKAK